MICDQIHLTMQKIPDTSYHYSDHEGVAAMFTVRRNVTGIPLLLLFGGHLYGNGICFANVAFLESIPLTPLNGSLRNFNTWRVSVGSITLQRDYLVLGQPPKNLGPKNYIFSMPLQLNGNFEGQCLWWGTWHYRQSGNSVGNYKGSHILSQNVTNFGPLRAKNRTVVFTHPLKSTWWRQPLACSYACQHFWPSL